MSSFEEMPLQEYYREQVAYFNAHYMDSFYETIRKGEVALEAVLRQQEQEIEAYNFALTAETAPAHLKPVGKQPRRITNDDGELLTVRRWVFGRANELVQYLDRKEAFCAAWEEAKTILSSERNEQEVI